MSGQVDVPPYFLCPISLEIMKDPVTITTGITYDRESIERWIFSQNNTTCPVTKQAIIAPDSELTPNITLRRLIQSWCTLHAGSEGIERLPTPKPPVTKTQISKLLNEVRSSISTQSQIETLQTLKSIGAHSQTNRVCMVRAGTVEFLASLIVEKTLEASSRGHRSSSESPSDAKRACEEALTIIHGLHLSDSGLSYLNNNEFIESLTLIMQCGSDESRAYSAMLLKSMLEVAEPSVLTNLRQELFTELAGVLVDRISKAASKAALKVLINACPWGRNRIKAVESGLVTVLIESLLECADKRANEMTLVTLDMLCQCAEGRAEMVKHGAGLAVVSKKILRVSNVASECAVRVLHSIAKFSSSPFVLQEMLQMGVVAKLCLVLQVNCGQKIKEKARDMLKLHARFWKSSPCIPKGLLSAYPS